MRADARRNYDAVLAAAKELFAQRGVDVPLDEVAKRAGVGNATMYRHFPTRRDMMVAVYQEEVVELCDRGRELLGDPSPVDALFVWLGEFVAHVATKRCLAMAAVDDAQRSPLAARWHESMIDTASQLMARAEGGLRPGLDVADLLALAKGIALSDTPEARIPVLLDLARSGAVRTS
ncbi:TetR/AcrR family transcriptional regulator [Nonomuraea sp. NPDC050556]|uniref:TetR/AcrR family transcriptional regulator n=1 Tax=Nonomuraea sp. NPDC050556 TaxID=3364369 RepID=UPI003789413F